MSVGTKNTSNRHIVVTGFYIEGVIMKDFLLWVFVYIPAIFTGVSFVLCTVVPLLIVLFKALFGRE